MSLAQQNDLSAVIEADRSHLWHRHPDWFLHDRYGKHHRLDDHYTIVNPCLPEVRAYLVAVFSYEQDSATAVVRPQAQPPAASAPAA